MNMVNRFVEMKNLNIFIFNRVNYMKYFFVNGCNFYDVKVLVNIIMELSSNIVIDILFIFIE